MSDQAADTVSASSKILDPKDEFSLWRLALDNSMRINALEVRAKIVEDTILSLKGDTSQIIHFLDGAQGVTSFVRRHAGRAIAFTCGTLAAAGIGNVNVWHFIGHFFGG